MDQQGTSRQMTTERLWHELLLDEVQTAVASRNAGGLSHQEALTIFAVILFVIATEVVNETRAKRAMAALSTLAEPTAMVRREGRTEEIPAEAIVPGDVLLLEARRRVPADGRLLEAASLSIDESALTGEALPVEKRPEERLPAETPLAERHNMVFSGTLVVRGQGTALVVVTGMQSAIGHIASLTRGTAVPG